jgi:transglutaminase-like putative cysteine protease
MLLKITHTTSLEYSEPISESVMELRMVPRQERDQHRLSFSLGIGPPANVQGYFDWVGNTVHTFSIRPVHDRIRIVATSVVETERRHGEVERFADRWPLEPERYDYTMYDYVHFGGPVVESPELSQLVEMVAPRPGVPLGEIALRMLYLIDDKFKYKKGITTSASPITELLKNGAGVCQDFTHLMIGLARAMKIPARYVSGFLHPDSKRLRGHTQTHAWCELLFPSQGWIGFDPANRCVVGGNFVKVAVGRDFRDVPPNRGVFRGQATEAIDVRVNSQELTSIPSELAAERIERLDLAAMLEEEAAEAASQQASQQQQ